METRLPLSWENLPHPRRKPRGNVGFIVLKVRSRPHVHLLEPAIDGGLESQVGSSHFVHVGDIA